MLAESPALESRPRREPFARAMIPLCAASTPLVEYLFRPDGCTLEQTLRAIAASSIPLLLVPGVLYAFYRWLVPHLLPPRWHSPRRLVLHIPLVVALTGSSALVLTPLVGAVHARTVADPIRFTTICIVLSLIVFLPAMVLQETQAIRQAAELRARRERQDRLAAQLAALQARTSPHFLFNTLNTVASLIHDDPVLAEDTLARLATLFRYTLEGSRLTSVTLENELAICEDYLEISAARFGERFGWRFAVEPAVRGVTIAPMVLQPLIENAVIHGVARRTRDGWIDLSVRLIDGALVCVVTDNGPGVAGPMASEGTGTALADLRARLAILDSDAGRGALVTETLPDGGFRASVVMPILSFPAPAS
jgi:two-component system, LytTR family, sensor histidine kinase AlgZ